MATQAKPTNGFLMYGTELIEKDKPFPLLAITQKRLVAGGAKKSLFHKHYYFTEQHLINYLIKLKNNKP